MHVKSSFRSCAALVGALLVAGISQHGLAQSQGREIVEIDSTNQLGQGYNIAKRATTQICIDFTTPSTTVGFGSIDDGLVVYTSKEELVRDTGVGVSVSIASGTASSTADFARNSAISAYSLAFAAKSAINTRTENILSATLKPEFLAILEQDPVTFFERCGTHYMSSIMKFASYVGLVTTNASSAAVAQELSVRVAGNWPTFRASGAFSDEERRILENTQGRYSQHVKGAGPFTTPTPLGALQDQLTAVVARFDEFDDLAAQSGGEARFATLHSYETLVNWPVGGLAIPGRNSVFDDLFNIYWDVEELLGDIGFVERSPGQFYFDTQERLDALATNKRTLIAYRNDLLERIRSCRIEAGEGRCRVPGEFETIRPDLAAIRSAMPVRFQGNCNLQPGINTSPSTPAEALEVKSYLYEREIEAEQAYVRRLPKIGGGGRDMDDPAIVIKSRTDYRTPLQQHLRMELEVIIAERGDDQTTYGASRAFEIFDVARDARGCRIIDVVPGRQWTVAQTTAADDQYQSLDLEFDSHWVRRATCLTDTRGRSDEYDLYCENIDHRPVGITLENIERGYSQQQLASVSVVPGLAAQTRTSQTSLGDKVNAMAERIFSDPDRSLIEVRAGQPPLSEDCVTFNLNTTSVAFLEGSWKIIDGNSWLFDFDQAPEEAEEAFDVIRSFGFDRTCYVNRPHSEMIYLKTGASVPQGPHGSFDCIFFSPASVSVEKEGERWLLTTPRSRMLVFDEEGEARASKRIIETFRLNRQCFVGRPDPSFVFWLAE